MFLLIIYQLACLKNAITPSLCHCKLQWSTIPCQIFLQFICIITSCTQQKLYFLSHLRFKISLDAVWPRCFILILGTPFLSANLGTCHFMSGTQGRGSAATLIFLSLPFLRTQVISDTVVKIRDKESSTRIHGHLLKSFLCNLVTIFYQDHVYQFFLNKRVCRRSLVIN